MNFESTVYNMPKGQVTRVYEGLSGEVEETRKFSEIFPVNIDRNRDLDARAPLSLAAQIMDLFRRCYFSLAGYTKVTLKVSLKSDPSQTQLTQFYVLKKELIALDKKTDALARGGLDVGCSELNPNVTESDKLKLLRDQATELQDEIQYAESGIDPEGKRKLSDLIAEERMIKEKITELLRSSKG